MSICMTHRTQIKWSYGHNTIDRQLQLLPNRYFKMYNLAPCTILGNHITLHWVKFLFSVGLLTSDKLISSSFLNGNDLYVSHRTEAFPCNQAIAKAVAKNPLEKNHSQLVYSLTATRWLRNTFFLVKLSESSVKSGRLSTLSSLLPSSIFRGAVEHSKHNQDSVGRTNLYLWSTTAQTLVSCSFKSKIYPY